MPAELLTSDNLLWAGKLTLVLGFGFSLGLTLADIDLAPPLPLKHRSAWTHGPFIPLALWYLNPGGDWYRLFSMAFLPGFALHLSYDMFPKAWQSIACISFHPLPGRLPGFLSFLYLWLGVITAIGLDFLLLEQSGYVLINLILLIGVGISFKHYMHKEPGGWPWPLNKLGLPKGLASVPPLLMLALGGGVAGVGVYYLNQVGFNQ
jgi:hypothetical protein